MGRKVKFGGPNLPKGTSTWYEHRNPDGTHGGQVRVDPGDVVDEDNIGGVIEFQQEPYDAHECNGASYYIESGRAAYVKNFEKE
jgi:hypothetical protein